MTDTTDQDRAEYDVELDAYWAAEEANGDDGGEPTQREFCDDYVVHHPHVYVAINHAIYKCPGLNAAELAECEALWNQPPCEHGMSAHLCAGPMHWHDPS